MTPEEVQTLSVLDAIESNSRVSQRDLSRITGINLAKVNHLLKKMVQKGVVKLHNVSASPNKLRYLYLLTPRGFSEKSRLTVRFAARTWREYSETLERFRSSLIRLSEKEARRVVLLGSNEVADMVIDVVAEIAPIEIVALVDPKRVGQKHRGLPVVDFAAVKGLKFDRIVPCVDGNFSADELAAKAEVPADRIWLV